MLRKLLITALLLAGLFAGLDRVAVYLAQSEIERRAKQDAGTDVQAKIHGFPFLLQVARRDINDVTLEGDRVRIGSGIGVRHVKASLSDVDVHDVTDPIASSLVLDGEVPFSDVATRLGLPTGSLRSAGANRVRFAEAFPVAGVPRTVTVIGTVRASGATLVITPSSVKVPGVVLPAQALAVVKSGLTVRYPVAGLPPGATVRIRGLSSTGFLVQITAHDISLG